MSHKKIIIISSVMLILSLVGFTVYNMVIQNAESSLKYLVEVQSDGHLILDVKKVKLNFLELRYFIDYAELRTKDTTTTITGYHVKVKRISLDVKSLIPILFKKQMTIESVIVLSPEIEVYKYKEEAHRKISLPDEMDKVYRSIESVLGVLKLDYFHINSAKFTVFNRYDKAITPMQISKLNLTVDKVSADKSLGESRFLFSDRILLEISDQDIRFQDENHRIKFRKLWLSTKSRTIKLDSCYIYSRHPDSTAGELKIFIDSITISKLDFNLLAKKSILKFDSALCSNPDIFMRIGSREVSNQIKHGRNNLYAIDSVEIKLKDMLGNLDIGYLGVRNAKINIIASKGNKSNVFKSSNSNFAVEKLLVTNESSTPIQIGRINFNIQHYEGFSPDSLYVIRFDTISIQNKKMSLINFRIAPAKPNQLLWKEMKMRAFELDELNWVTLIYENRIVAGRASLVKPEIQLQLSDKKGNKNQLKSQTDTGLLKEIEDKVQIDKIFIKDGSVKIDAASNAGFSLDHLFAQINVKQIFQSENVFKMVDALENLSFSHGSYHNPALTMELIDATYSLPNKIFLLGQVNMKKSDESIASTFQNVSIKGLGFNSESNIRIEGLAWKKGNLALNLKNSEQKTKPVNAKTDLRISISHLSGGQTKLSVNGNNLGATTLVNQVMTNEIVIQRGQQPIVSGLKINGQSSNLIHNLLNSSISDFNIRDKKYSSLDNVELKLPFKGEIATIFVPKLIFSPDISPSINGKITADYIEFQNPSISFQNNPTITEKKIKENEGRIPLLNIKRLTISQPKIVNLPTDLAGKVDFDPGVSIWNFTGINSDGAAIKVDSFDFAMAQPKFGNNQLRLVPSGKENVSIAGSELIFHPGAGPDKPRWSVNLDQFKTSDLLLNLLQAETLSHAITLKNLNIEGIRLNSKNAGDPKEIMKESDRFGLSDGNIKFETQTKSIETFNLKLDKAAGTLMLDSIAFFPLIRRSHNQDNQLEDKDAFMKTKEYQADYMKLYSGNIKMNGLDFNLLMNDSIVRFSKGTINDLYLSDYKDKRLPFQHGNEKPMLTELIKGIKFKLAVDTLLLRNSRIDYEELNEKTEHSGTVKFRNIKGVITGIKNYNISATDSLRFNIYTRFMNATDLRVSYVQSYTDTLSIFYLKAITSSFDLTALNPILKPLASAEVAKGYLDTIRMSVVGRKYVAFGVMKLYYHDLRIQYLDKTIKGRNTLKSKIISFFANTIVHKNNQIMTGDVYAERDPERGFINYWVKIFIGGAFTNTGVKTNRKQERKYNQSIDIHKVPPIRNIPVDY
jgi:hypothetical protein